MKTGFIGGKFLPFHIGHLYAIMYASNFVDKLYVVLISSVKRDRTLCEQADIKYISGSTRKSWISKELNNFDNIEVIEIVDNCSADESEYDWENGAKDVRDIIVEPLTHVFSSEHSYTPFFKKYYPNAEHIVIDSRRDTINISATEIKKDIYSNWEYLTKSARQFFTKKVAIVGTESCGKSMLTKQLANLYYTNYCHEVGRDYCKRYKNNLTIEMFPQIAMEHILLQDKLAYESNKVLFVDSDAVITQYYMGMYFDRASTLVENIIDQQDFDLILYLEPDVPWVDDGLRFQGEVAEREENNYTLKGMYKRRHMPFHTITGTYLERLLSAKKIVDKLFK